MLKNKEMEEWKKFQRIWTKEKIQKMTLEEYHTAGAKQKCFAYWIEYKLDYLGNINEPRGSEHYGIYNPQSKEQKQNDSHIWDRNKYGDDKEEAFKIIKNNILKIIEYSQNNELEQIDKIDMPRLYKWKIAFCYQDINNLQMIPIFKEELLKKIVKEEFGLDSLKKKTSEIYKIIIDRKPSDKDIFDFSDSLFEKYGGKTSDEKSISNKSFNEKTPINIPLNRILYGPPGTGKTYHAIDKALKILGYTEKLTIERKLKEMEKDIGEDRKNQKMLFEYFLEQGQIEFVTFHQNYGYEEFVEGIKPVIDEPTTNKEGNEIQGGVKYKVQDGVFKRISKKATKSLGEFEETHPKFSKMNNKRFEKLKPYILIIDEINRGNISKIFGELITLIEPSKRIGNDEELTLTLPYSEELFGVPKNLYIIGTMNTADRSIAFIDTALRRRFDFIEMMPKSDIKELKDLKEVDLPKMLKSMNDRIEFIYDREHTIGQAFFIDVKTLVELKKVFHNKIIPLLQEYFYEDYAKIDAVLNGNGMIEQNKVTPENIFSINVKHLGLEDKESYKIVDFEKPIWGEASTYQKIIKNKETNRR